MAEAVLRKAQTFPIYYPAEAPFTVDGASGGTPSGLVGARANLTFQINTRPHGFLGVRIRNVFAIPPFPLSTTNLTYFPSWRDIHGLDVDQDMSLELAQQNVVVRTADQGCVIGGPGIGGSYVWHPFACVYPFRGGNNVVIQLRRTVSYPLVVNATEAEVEGIFPIAKAVLVGYTYVTADIEEGGPPSSDF
jgi:hypothetical protein